jgi:enoyl-CoA hydratase/carnithine racemase
VGCALPLQAVQFERSNGVAWLTFNRPHARNAFTNTMLSEIGQLIQEVQADGTVKALVLTGAGDDAFCVGSDIAFLNDAFSTHNLARFRDYLEQINGVLFALEELQIPTIAMVQGKARAGGFELIMACDFVIVANDILLGDVHTPFGHLPGAGASQRLARKVGIQKALAMIMTGTWMTGREAADCGLALMAVPRDELRTSTEAFASTLVEKTRNSLGFVKREILRGWDLPLRDAVRLEMQSYIEYLATSVEPYEIFRANQERRNERRRGAAVAHDAAQAIR